MDIALPIYHKPGPTPVPAALKNTCMVCGEPGYHAPGPCKSCGVYGYPGEQPPGLQLGRVWRRKGRDYMLEDHDDDLLEGSDLEDTTDLDLELSASSLDLLDFEEVSSV